VFSYAFCLLLWGACRGSFTIVGRSVKMSNTVSLCETLLSGLLQTKTDFSLCIKCQVAGGSLVISPQPESYTKFLDAVRQRAELDDGDFPAISRRLHQYTAAKLVPVFF